MTTGSAASRRRAEAAAGTYQALLRRHLAAPGEAGLSQAYRLGRELLSAETGLLEVLALHHHALAAVLDELTPAEASAAAAAAGQLLCETMAGYEMKLRGFADANAALRGMNQRLEDQVERIAHALHDESGQLLAAVMIALDQMQRGADEPHRTELARVRGLLDRVEVELRRLAHELHPALLADLGLRPALEFLTDGIAARSSLVITIEGQLPGRLPTATELCLYRCVQEALNNVVRHAQARRVRILLRAGSHDLELAIADDGRGFDPAAVARGGMGLAGMRERLAAVDGALELQAQPGQGVNVRLRVGNVLWGGHHVATPLAG